MSELARPKPRGKSTFSSRARDSWSVMIEDFGDSAFLRLAEFVMAGGTHPEARILYGANSPRNVEALSVSTVTSK